MCKMVTIYLNLNKKYKKNNKNIYITHNVIYTLFEE